MAKGIKKIDEKDSVDAAIEQHEVALKAIVDAADTKHPTERATRAALIEQRNVLNAQIQELDAIIRDPAAEKARAILHRLKQFDHLFGDR